MESRHVPMIFWMLLLCTLVAANMFIYQEVFALKTLAIHVLSVGKAGEGNSTTLVKAPGGKTLLIDVGPDASILRVLGTTLPPWQRSLDTIILTSDKVAQAGGLASVEGRYYTGEVLRAGTAEFPYGTTISFAGIPITITAPGKYELK